MQLGISVVARRVGGISEAVQHGESGLLVEGAEPRALAEAWQALAVDKAMRERMAESARDAIARRFSAAANALRVASLYRELLANKR